MSHDAQYVVRERGVDRMYHSRWGGLRIDRLLLRNGPSELLAHLRGLRAWEYGADAHWLTGYVLVDVDRRFLLYWASEFFGGSEMAPYFRLLLARRWPGWATRWATRPSCDLGEALGGDHHAQIDGRLRAEPQCDTVSSCSERLHFDPYSWPYAGPEVCVTVRGADGTLRDYEFAYEDPDWGHIIGAGPVLLEALQAHPAVASDEGSWWHTDQTLLVDVRARALMAWQETTEFAQPAFHAEQFWPARTVSWHDGGWRGH